MATSSFRGKRVGLSALLIAEGAHAKAIQEAMGHSSIVVTMNTYGHLMPRLLEEVVDRMEASLFPNNERMLAADFGEERAVVPAGEAIFEDAS